MSNSSADLQLGTDPSSRASNLWRRKAPHFLGALVIHLAPLALLVGALPLKPRDLGGAFGQSVSVTLVSSAPSPARAPSATVASAQPNLARLEQRLSAPNETSPFVPASSSSTPSTSLSDLFGSPGDGAPKAAKGLPAPSTGADDDPFARTFVSYRGDDPAKAARLQSQARRCAKPTRPARVLLIINSEGNLVARPKLIGAGSVDKAAAKAMAAIEACGPFLDAATQGPPRSYEINLG